MMKNRATVRRRASFEASGAHLNGEDNPLQPVAVQPAEVFGRAELINRQGTVRTLPSHLQDKSSASGNQRMAGLDGFFCARFTRVN